MDEDRFPSQEMSSIQGRTVSSNSAYKSVNRTPGSVQSDSILNMKKLSRVRAAKEQDTISNPKTESIKE